MALKADDIRATSYSQILSSTALMAASTIVNVIFNILRVKVVAVLLGPSGVGLMGLYSSISELMQNVASLGIQGSGVRQIAAAAGSNDETRIAVTALVLRRTSYVLGLAGAALVILCAVPISSITFGSSHPASGVALLSFAVLIRTISTGQTALLQGLRRISELARMNILAGALGTALTVPLIFAFGEQGVVLAVIAIAAASLFASWTYSRRILLADVRFLRSQMGRETLALLTLGVSFLVSSLLTLGAAYVVRILVLRAGGIESAGIYQAAWTIGGLYAAFILSAMGTDFYPRLTAVSTNNAECNRLVNEQTRISLLLAGPGVLATVTFAPLILTVFFSKDFLPAANILRWICLGMMLRISSWPMGFIVLAKGAQKIFVWTEVAATVVHVGLAWLLVDQVGVDGAGIAFFGLYVWHTAFIYVIVRRLSGFDWSRDNVKLALLFLTTTAGVLCGLRYLPMWSGLALGGGAVIICGLYSVREVLALVTFERLPGPLQSWFGTKAGRA